MGRDYWSIFAHFLLYHYIRSTEIDAFSQLCMAFDIMSDSVYKHVFGNAIVVFRIHALTTKRTFPIFYVMETATKVGRCFMYIKFFYNVVQIIDSTCESVGHLSAYSHHNYIIIQGVSNMNATSFTSFFTYMLR